MVVHARPNAVAKVCIVKKICKTVIIARLIVRLEARLSFLGRDHPIFCSALSLGGATQKSGGAHQSFVPSLSN